MVMKRSKLAGCISAPERKRKQKILIKFPEEIVIMVHNNTFYTTQRHKHQHKRDRQMTSR